MNPTCLAPISVFSYVFGLNMPFECAFGLSSLDLAPTIDPGFYVLVFLLTCLLEAPTYFALFVHSKKKLKSMLSAVFSLNLATHPIVVFVIPIWFEYLHKDYGTTLFFSEIFAIAVEAYLLIYIWKISKAKSFFASIIANLFSWWLGVYLLR